jgi:hypothetical protein
VVDHVLPLHLIVKKLFEMVELWLKKLRKNLKN